MTALRQQTTNERTNNYPNIEPLQIFGLIGFRFWFDLEFGNFGVLTCVLFEESRSSSPGSGVGSGKLSRSNSRRWKSPEPSKCLPPVLMPLVSYVLMSS